MRGRAPDCQLSRKQCVQPDFDRACLPVSLLPVAFHDSFTSARAEAWDNFAMPTTNLDFLYLEKDPRTEQPSACIYVKLGGQQDFAGVCADRLISAHCMSFIELDSELRRLHAELDEIRSLAKKKFYKAEVASAGAQS